jgi:hypothetical protein
MTLITQIFTDFLATKDTKKHEVHEGCLFFSWCVFV